VPEPFWLRHDLHVVAAAVGLLALGWVVQARAGDPPHKTVELGPLAVEVPAGWLVERSTPTAVVARGEDAVTRVELSLVEATGEKVPLESSLELLRAQRHGPLYQRHGGGTLDWAGRTWQRTSFSFAFRPSPGHAPRVASAVEVATQAGDRLLLCTVIAPPERIAELEPEILGSLSVSPAGRAPEPAR
jgi:hypothetical protein